MEDNKKLKEFIKRLKEKCDERSYPIFTKQYGGEICATECFFGSVNVDDINKLAEEFGVEV